ncbi:protein phosphatase 1, regulatory subunit 17-like [Solea solea]|uniref:protein phosphatase 1, regulatory subunit 17-like n=1 Tax=Solea solea TaxID=90069 RepID=UPI002729F258|nr:protein phosphatase 1, regulatory subunit 17-like [Solea solea]
MTTSCMRSTLDPEHRLMTQESKHYQGVESSVDRKLVVKDEKDKDEAQEEDQLKKPRRKDTPILNCPPLIPGVRQLKAAKQVVHLEDAEKDVNN